MANLLNLAMGEPVDALLEQDYRIDLLVLTQHWPYTTCLDWQEKQHGGCRKIQEDTWTVRGLWPTNKISKEISPSFCNNSWPFEASNLEPIMSEMKAYWPDIELRVPNSLYEHEWKKHGTCAVAGKLPGISTQQDYFTVGCRLAKKNPIATWLKEWDIVPSATSRYTMGSVWNAMVAGSGTKPRIDCDKIDGEVYVKEIKVCYDNSLVRIDCDEDEQGMIGTCSRYVDFLYPDSIIPPSYFPKTTDVPETTSEKITITTTSSSQTSSTSTKTSPSLKTSTRRPFPNSRSEPSTGFIAGIICGILALIVVGLGIALFIYKRRSARSGYQSI